MSIGKILDEFGSAKLQVHFLTTIFEHLPVAVFVKDADDDMRIILWNNYGEKLFGIAPSDIIGKTISDLFPKDLAEKFNQDDHYVIEQCQTVFEANRVLKHWKTKEDVDFRIWKVPVKTSHCHLVLCIAQDMTEIKKAEIEIRRQAEQIKSISNRIPGVIYQFKVDSIGKFSFPYCSSKASEVLGVPAEVIVQDADSVLKLIHEDDQVEYERSTLHAFRNGIPWEWEGRMRVRDEVRWFRGTSSPSRHNDGSVTWDGFFFDITEQKEAEELLRIQEAQLADSSKLIALGEMAGGVAHEINTPLNAILFCADQIQTSLKENSFDKRELFEMTGLIAETAQRIAKIVKGLKSFARDGSGENFEDTDVNGVIDQVLSLCRQRFEQNGIKVDIKLPDFPVSINCRPIQLGQVLLNLLNNAFDAIAESKWAWVKLEVLSDFESVKIVITDSGNGISKDVRGKLFQPFFTTKKTGKGTGIGLSISRNIIEAHRGKIYVDEASENTRFIVELPRKITYREVS